MGKHSAPPLPSPIRHKVAPSLVLAFSVLSVSSPLSLLLSRQSANAVGTAVTPSLSPYPTAHTVAQSKRIYQALQETTPPPTTAKHRRQTVIQAQTRPRTTPRPTPRPAPTARAKPRPTVAQRQIQRATRALTRTPQSAQTGRPTTPPPTSTPRPPQPTRTTQPPQRAATPQAVPKPTPKITPAVRTTTPPTTPRTTPTTPTTTTLKTTSLLTQTSSSPSTLATMTTNVDVSPVAFSTTLGNRIVATGKKYVGRNLPYRMGGSSLTSGIDCSHFVHRVLTESGLKVPYRSSSALAAWTTRTSSPRPGDLVLYRGHVGIYAGGGMMVHHGKPGGAFFIKVYKQGFIGYGRLP